VLPVPITVMAPKVKVVPFVEERYPALRLGGCQWVLKGGWCWGGRDKWHLRETASHLSKSGC
jgi:hypothetical protein